MKCPCKDCDRRSLSCHGKCEEYKAYHEWRDKVNYERWINNQKGNRDAQPFWRKTFRKNQLRKPNQHNND